MIEKFLTICRAANVLLISLALLALIVWLSDTWGDLSFGRKLSMTSIRVLLLGGVVGSAIKYATGAPVDVSVLIVTLSSIGVIVGQWLARHEARTVTVPAAAVLAIVDGVEHDTTPPCTHPGCIQARIELRNLTHHHPEAHP